LRRNHGVVCAICRWEGDAFDGAPHSESAMCPQCGSVSRDRFLFLSFVARTPESLGARVWETSPRLGGQYRSAMATWFQYTCSDYDESAHRGTVRIDLQDVALPDESIDVLLTPHVLEHVPDTGRALAEIQRVLAPGGRMFLQVPILQGITAPPTTPEFHGDNTPVFWRFGYDLVDTLAAHDFAVSMLCTQGWQSALDARLDEWPGPVSGEFDVASMLRAARTRRFATITDDVDATRLGVQPAYQFLTFECLKGR